MLTLKTVRIRKLQKMWLAGPPAVSSADRGRTAQPGPGTMRRLDSMPLCVTPWQGMEEHLMTPTVCPVTETVERKLELLPQPQVGWKKKNTSDYKLQERAT